MHSLRQVHFLRVIESAVRLAQGHDALQHREVLHRLDARVDEVLHNGHRLRQPLARRTVDLRRVGGVQLGALLEVHRHILEVNLLQIQRDARAPRARGTPQFCACHL